MDKVVQITQSFVGNKIKGIQGDGKKRARLEIFVGPEGSIDHPSSPDWNKEYTISESLSIKSVDNPDEFIWNALAGEDPGGIIYLVVPENMMEYMIRVDCPGCVSGDDYLYFYGTFVE